MIKVRYGALQTLPQHPGDKDPPTYVRDVICTSKEDEYYVAGALERLGFHVLRAARHPNGKGGNPLRVFGKKRPPLSLELNRHIPQR